MMQDTTKNVLLPVLISAAVLLISLTLITITARSPYTHANLNLSYDPGYTRTDQTFVGAPIPFSSGGLAVPPASDQVERGKQLFVSDGCAACHGLEGRGGIIGPSIIGTKASKLRAKTLAGPNGMPAYVPGALTDDDLAAIAAYLKAMHK